MSELASPTTTTSAEAHALKVPPHSLEAEQAVLGGLMLDTSAWELVAERIQEVDFYRGEHRTIFRNMAKVMANDQPIDVITVGEMMETAGDLEKIGGLPYLTKLAENTPSAANITAYADIVRERSLLRQLVTVGAAITRAAFEPKGRVALELLDEAEQQVFHIAEKGTAGTGPRIIANVLTGTLSHIQHLFEAQQAITGISTGFRDFDNLTAGLQSGDLVIVAGRPSMGKTVLGMNFAEHVAVGLNKPVLVFSMEMPAEQLVVRTLSSLGRIDQHRLRTGRLTDRDWESISSKVETLSGAPLYIDDSSGLSPHDVRTRARRVARETGQLGLIVVDYLQLMRCPGYNDNRVGEISEISRSLKALAKELKVPVVALSQLNRSLEQRPNKRPVMADLRESGAIEQDADLIAFIYRDEVYHEDSPDKGTAEIIISKHRNGPTGMVRMTFLGQYTRFENFVSQ